MSGDLRLQDISRSLALAFEPPWPTWEQVMDALDVMRDFEWALAIGDASRREGRLRSANPHPGPRTKIPPRPTKDDFDLAFWRWNYDPHQAWDDGWMIADGLIARKLLDEKPCGFGCVGTFVRADCERHNPPQIFHPQPRG